MNKVRVDKWLWSVRIFKSRTLATDACKSGKVKINDNNVKASYMLTRDEIIKVKKNGFNYTYKVVDLIDKRVGAKLAAPCYENLTPEEEMNKYQDWFLNHSRSFERRDKGEGRPTKRDRRTIDKFKKKE
ncbi:MAG: RNA-binding S4 domain-containing protein [Saprospiraceae bacterium]